MASPPAHLFSVFTQLCKQGPPSLPTLCSVLAKEVINSFSRGLSSEPSPTQRSPTGGPWTASSPQMCFVWLFLCVFLIAGLVANTLKIMKFLTQMQISTFEKNHKGHITACEQLAEPSKDCSCGQGCLLQSATVPPLPMVTIAVPCSAGICVPEVFPF